MRGQPWGSGEIQGDLSEKKNCDGSTVLREKKEPRYYVKSENQLLRCKNLGLKNGRHGMTFALYLAHLKKRFTTT